MMMIVVAALRMERRCDEGILLLELLHARAAAVQRLASEIASMID